MHRAPPRSEAAHWTAEHTRRFLVAVDASPRRALWTLALHADLRRGEFLGLRWEDVGLGQLRIHRTRVMADEHLVESTPKTNAGRRTVGIGPHLDEALRVHRALQDEQRAAAGPPWREQGIVFATEVGTPLDPHNLRRELRWLCAAAGVPVIPIHGLRHTFASLALAGGVPIRDLARPSGKQAGRSRSRATVTCRATRATPRAASATPSWARRGRSRESAWDAAWDNDPRVILACDNHARRRRYWCNYVQRLTVCGGDGRIRTDDPLRAKQVLSQLSYIPVRLLPIVLDSLTGYDDNRTAVAGYAHPFWFPVIPNPTRCTRYSQSHTMYVKSTPMSTRAT